MNPGYVAPVSIQFKKEFWDIPGAGSSSLSTSKKICNQYLNEDKDRMYITVSDHSKLDLSLIWILSKVTQEDSYFRLNQKYVFIQLTKDLVEATTSLLIM